MALHHELRTMVSRFGNRLLEDGDTLRAALDDYLTEGTATGGEINLLVDAVRLGAFRQLQDMVSGGADPASAVRAAGEMLARERGSSDVTGSSWAVAALGFAAGQVPEAEVQQFDASTRLAPGAGDGPTTVYPVRQPGQPGQPQQPPGQPQQPPGQPQQPPGSPPGYGGDQYGQPAAGQYGQPAGGQYGQPGAGQYGQPGQQPYSAYGAPGHGGYGPPPKKKSKTTPILAAIGAVLVLALVAAGLWVAFGGGGDDEEAYCDLYREADQQFEDSDFTSMGGSFEDLKSTVSEIRDVAPAEVDDDWETIDTAFTDLEEILAKYDLSLEDLPRLTAGELPEGLTTEELTELGTELQTWGSSGDFEAAGDRIDEDAQERCDVPAGGDTSG